MVPTRKVKKKNSVKVLLTVGPTRAYLDPIRYLTNYSTGALGFLLAKRFVEAGFEGVVVRGPCHQPFEEITGLQVVSVETAEEMLQATLKACESFRPDYAIFTAAVLDFRPERVLESKKSSRDNWKIKLVPNPKIIDEVGRLYPQIKKIGFKLETEKPTVSEIGSAAKQILRRKKLVGVCINFFSDLQEKRHPAWFFSKNEKKKLSTKSQIADCIVRFITEQNKAV